MVIRDLTHQDGIRHVKSGASPTSHSIPLGMVRMVIIIEQDAKRRFRGMLWARERSIGINGEVRLAIKITEESVVEIVTVLVVENSVCRWKITGRRNIAT